MPSAGGERRGGQEQIPAFHGYKQIRTELTYNVSRREIRAVHLFRICLYPWKAGIRCYHGLGHGRSAAYSLPIRRLSRLSDRAAAAVA